MTMFLQFLFCIVVAGFLAFRFYWYGREDGFKAGTRCSDERYRIGREDGYAVGYESAQGDYDRGYNDGWAYRNKRMGGGA